MIGPIAPGVSFLTVAEFDASPVLPGVALIASNGTAAISHSTSGIINLGGNSRGKLLTAPSTPGWYIPEWDDNGGAPFPDEVLLVQAAVAQATTATSGSGVDPAKHLIKRNDTEPVLTIQCRVLDPSDATGRTTIPFPIPSGATVKFTMRDVNDFSARTRTSFTVATPKIHANAAVVDAANGIISYGFDGTGDTDTDGVFRGEFEITTLGGEIRTFPTGLTDDLNYIAITIPDDLDPGITP